VVVRDKYVDENRDVVLPGSNYCKEDDEPSFTVELVKPERKAKTEKRSGTKRSERTQVDFNTMYSQYTLTSNPIFTYEIGAERKAKVEKKVNMQGGINQSLKANGCEPEGNCSDAIKKAYEKGLIDEETRDYCIQVNQNGNDGTHNWGQKAGNSKTKELVDNPKTLSNPIFTYKAGPERMIKISNKNNTHGGINQLLKKNGLEPEGVFYVAVEKAYHHGLIDEETRNQCHGVNLDGNVGNHKWGQKK
jgi:hypothetical protein